MSKPSSSANAAVRRIMQELRQLQSEFSPSSSLFYAAPLESDLFEWHFTARGPPGSPFENGLYHGRILLPPEYPMKAPEIILLTPNGRFEVGTRICLSVTSFHQETWQPSWGVRTIITALVGFMTSKAEGVGAVDFPDEDRRRLAAKSRSFQCPICNARAAEQLDDLENSAQTSAAKDGEKRTAVDAPGVEAKDAADGIKPVETEKKEPVGPVDVPKAPVKQGDTHVEDLSCSSAGPTVDSQPGSTQPSQAAPQTEPQAASQAASQLALQGAPQEALRGQTARHPAITGATGTAHQSTTSERELLYLAYAIVVAILVVILRRLHITFDLTEF